MNLLAATQEHFIRLPDERKDRVSFLCYKDFWLFENYTSLFDMFFLESN